MLPKSHAPQLPDLAAIDLEAASGGVEAAKAAGRQLSMAVSAQIEGLMKGTGNGELQKQLSALKKKISGQLAVAAKKADAGEIVAELKKAVGMFVSALPELRKEFFQAETSERTAGKPDESVGSGGNCLFDSASKMLGGTPNSATLRQLTADEARNHPLRYVDRLVASDEHTDVMIEMAAAADFLAVNDNWDANAGEIAPLALANALRRQIYIYNMDGSLRTVVGFLDEHQPLHVFYNGWNHYMPMS